MSVAIVWFALRLVLLVAVAYGGLVALLYFFQAKLIFIPSPTLYRTPAQQGWPYEDVLLEVAGEQTHGWWVPLENARGVALFSHGNAGNIADRIESIALLRSFGLSVLAYDYGGYGQSTGSASEQRCYADIRAMWRYLTETRGIPLGDIILFGRSLGAAVTLDLAAEVKPAGVIIESAFLSTPDVGAEIYWWLPVRLLARFKFENKAKIGKVQASILIVHSPEDEIIPFRHGQELYRLAPEPKTFLEIGGGHNTGFVESEQVYRAGWEAFLDGNLTAAEERP